MAAGRGYSALKVGGRCRMSFVDVGVILERIGCKLSPASRQIASNVWVVVAGNATEWCTVQLLHPSVPASFKSSPCMLVIDRQPIGVSNEAMPCLHLGKALVCFKD